MDITGKVEKGKGKGKFLGFPTINLETRNKLESGVYAGAVWIEKKEHKAAIFIPEDKLYIEAHVLNFSDDVYDQEVEIEIKQKIREVIKFSNNQDLRNKIKEDIEKIKNLK